MKKQTARYIVPAIVMLLVVVCCFGVYNFFSSRNAKNEKPVNNIVFKCLPDNIMKISVNSINDSYSIVKAEEKWIIEELKDKKLIEESILSTVNVMSDIKGTKLSDFDRKLGFDIKVRIVTVPVEYSFELAQDNNEFFLKDENGDVYSVSQILYTIAKKHMNEYRDTSIHDIKNLTEGGDNKFVSYSYKPSYAEETYDEINIRVKNSTEIRYFSTDSPYMMDKPYLRSVDSEKFESLVLYALPSIVASEFISEDTDDLTAYGLDKDLRGELTVSYDDKTFRLYIGSETDKGSLYAMTDGNEQIFTIEKSKLEFLNSESFEFIEKKLYTYNSEYITRADVLLSDKKIVIRQDNDKFFVNENPVSDKTFNGFKEAIMKLEIGSISDKISGDEILRLNVCGRDGKTVKFVFCKTKDGKYIVSENEKLFYYLNGEQVNEFINFFSELEKTLI